MEEVLTRKKAKKIMELRGEARGTTIKENWSAILYGKGKDALKKVENKMSELGYPLKYNEIKATSFYPIGYDVISTLAIKEIFNLSEKELEEMSAFGVRFSLFFKILLKYFVSLRLIVPQIPKMWNKYYSEGHLEVIKLNQKEKYIILRLKDFAPHPIFCITIKGYFNKVLSMLVGVSASSQEKKCIFKGDKYHEFIIKWQ